MNKEEELMGYKKPTRTSSNQNPSLIRPINKSITESAAPSIPFGSFNGGTGQELLMSPAENLGTSTGSPRSKNSDRAENRYTISKLLITENLNTEVVS